MASGLGSLQLRVSGSYGVAQSAWAGGSLFPRLVERAAIP